MIGGRVGRPGGDVRWARYVEAVSTRCWAMDGPFLVAAVSSAPEAAVPADYEKRAAPPEIFSWRGSGFGDGSAASGSRFGSDQNTGGGPATFGCRQQFGAPPEGTRHAGEGAAG